MKLLHSALFPSLGSLPVNPHGEYMLQIQAFHKNVHRKSRQVVEIVLYMGVTSLSALIDFVS